MTTPRFIGVLDVPTDNPNVILMENGAIYLPDPDAPPGDWTPFDADDNLAAEGFVMCGAMSE
ncbi:gp78 [Mycobacterium phage Che9c]|uniref:Uncharacterized protein n=1 Tax=Mycobacterium phage Che9c TaxID=2907832 RepID=Q854S2_9CAUD|nr:gp78 [Mycobacterium phage Che9c]AAN12636.1 hypothetical protein PBI_CHE9C_78 [Mycobacterium phage Che9c]